MGAEKTQAAGSSRLDKLKICASCQGQGTVKQCDQGKGALHIVRDVTCDRCQGEGLIYVGPPEEREAFEREGAARRAQPEGAVVEAAAALKKEGDALALTWAAGLCLFIVTFVGAFGALSALLYGAPAAPLGRPKAAMVGFFVVVSLTMALRYLSVLSMRYLDTGLPLEVEAVLAASGASGP